MYMYMHCYTSPLPPPPTESDCCVRQWCGPSRPFSMAILDNTQREVIAGYSAICRARTKCIYDSDMYLCVHRMYHNIDYASTFWKIHASEKFTAHDLLMLCVIFCNVISSA